MQNINSFYKYLEFEKRSSVHTLTAYKNDVGQFCDYLEEKEINNWQKVTAKIIRQWMVEMLDQGVSARTVTRKISTLKVLFRFLIREEVLESNPTDKVTTPKIPKRLPIFVKETEMDILLDQIDFGEDYSGVRNKTIIDLFYFTGMRLSELVELTISQIDFSNEVIKVLGKRNKERIVPVTKELKMALVSYINKRKQTFPEVKNKVLFLTDKGNPVYQKLVYRVVNRYLSQVSTVTKKSPHVIRHSFATALLNKGADLNAIKELLGHANLAATEVYTHNSYEKLNSIYKQAHPRA
ncbi:tyrosine-type recombinase/integrase [Carboxylicivirga linearis]|uniref:Tyrosine recombinase XerC n=1 Tax=Carboxylicivirga linearis TaxID=1628157 RepID=A0ABS5K0E5_9BACT|nr:tyrosine-type recombinase/integrase [Carboxylicivirga linearis]MBS2100141.1 tyrosine-type recombinase/integrase [Carboxylicivirga linearis]